MKTPDIAKLLARQAKISRAEATDRVDGVVRQILLDLRKGRESGLPGLGKFTHGPDGKVLFLPEKGARLG